MQWDQVNKYIIKKERKKNRFGNKDLSQLTNFFLSPRSKIKQQTVREKKKIDFYHGRVKVNGREKKI